MKLGVSSVTILRSCCSTTVSFYPCCVLWTLHHSAENVSAGRSKICNMVRNSKNESQHHMIHIVQQSFWCSCLPSFMRKMTPLAPENAITMVAGQGR